MTVLPLFLAPPETSRYCDEHAEMDGRVVVKCDRLRHDDECHYDGDLDIWWSPYEVVEAP